MREKLIRYLLSKVTDHLFIILFGVVTPPAIKYPKTDGIMWTYAVGGGLTVFVLCILWDEREKICRLVSPLKRLAIDIEKLLNMELNCEGPLGTQRNTEYIALAENVIEKLIAICDVQKPAHSGQYPDFFKGIYHFVEKGDIKGVEKASRDIKSHYA